ncbi:Asp23/Gls24 family envelope stress response protein [Herbiconiux sp. KACC 21604]|uniref:Asp23/Gls24 family envelope stress response protein n=1 Tax=unclassified Herbiconiux TaxID=2618217 RepID=UPI001492D38F|nr:Asp23/Gls24 family envelope stress response protein [Herbiconiux sp. SALV-R1]QJU55331.1 Asp23/Gls24 family envelope stress response protein [Herbiconiux sp. SALV-R1]WPO86500.1 Asp23/Gls24 family envelope stress response protein [Herbiconiux sp. KACC 21604]
MTDDTAGTTLDCGKTVEELSLYLASGRTPPDPEIDTCPDCLNVLENLARLGGLSREVLQRDTEGIAPAADSWVDRLMTAVQEELRSGRDIPIQHPDPHVHITVSEGAVRALLRSVGDEVSGVHVTRTRIDGDVETPGAPVTVSIAIAAEWGQPLQQLADAVRSEAYDALVRHTDLTVAAIDVSVDELYADPSGKDPS